MANSNNRQKNFDTVHHLVSRIAHRVYFLKDEERKDFLEIVRRAAAYVDVRLIGWCVMENHFHLLVYLPEPQLVDEKEVLRRYGILKGIAAVDRVERIFVDWRKKGEVGEQHVSEWLDSQRRRMYSISSFMKIVKQWFTVDYNKRNAHKGTLWESAYFDRAVAHSESEMAKCLAYIHLNPIRAAVTDLFDGYAWSSYTAFRRGDPIAVAGMRFIYGDDVSEETIANRHESLLEDLLENEKLRRAEEIVRKRAAGYEVPTDPLTDEAMISQKKAYVEEVQNALVEFHEMQNVLPRCKDRNAMREKEVVALLQSNPEMGAPLLSEKLGIGLMSTYRILRELKRKGLIWQEEYRGRWFFKN